MSLTKLWYKDPLFRRASEAFESLETKGCEPQLIDGYLRRIAAYPNQSFAPGFLRGQSLYRINRKLRELSRQIRSLAKDIDEMRRHPANWDRFVQAQSATVHAELRRIAARLSKAARIHARKLNPHREAILDLLDSVRTTTGRYHYSEVADLINAAVYRYALVHRKVLPDFACDVDGLKAMMQRQKKPHAAKLNRRRIRRPPKS